MSARMFHGQVIVLAENYDGASRPIGMFPKDKWKNAALADFTNDRVPFRADFWFPYEQDHHGDWVSSREPLLRIEDLPGHNTMASAS
jgi:hypothetical protein